MQAYLMPGWPSLEDPLALVASTSSVEMEEILRKRRRLLPAALFEGAGGEDASDQHTNRVISAREEHRGRTGCVTHV